jgi:transmembrane sensor
MSDAQALSQPTTTGAIDIRSRAAMWLVKRRDHAQWSDEDQAALDAWLAESPAHMIAYIRLEAAWGYADRLAALRDPRQRKVSELQAIRGSFSAARVAGALFAVAVLGVAGAIYLQRPTEKIYATQLGGHRIVTLADGTQVELNTDTVLRVAIDMNRRTVGLERGEAYFQVRHDASRPFVVTVGDRRVTDIGTKFLVRREIGRLEVAVMQGKVRFDTASNDQTSMHSMLLLPGTVAIATAKSVFVTKASSRALTDRLGWRRGVLVFENTTLADAAAEFNRYNDRKLIVADPAAASMTIGGTFPTSNVEDFTGLVQSVLGLRIDRRGTDIVISR